MNIWQIPCALVSNFGTILAGRFLGGLSSAGGSATLGMVADMWEPDEQQYAVAFVVLSVGGTVLALLLALSFNSTSLGNRISGFSASSVWRCRFCMPETRSSVLVDREAKRRRKAGQPNVYGPSELKTFKERFNMTEILTIRLRPFVMFAREPIVLWLPPLSGFSDALIFTSLDSYGLVFTQWNFGIIALGLTFIPVLLGYFIAYFSFFPVLHKHRAIMRNVKRHRSGARLVCLAPVSHLFRPCLGVVYMYSLSPTYFSIHQIHHRPSMVLVYNLILIRNRGTDGLEPEARLWWLIFTAPLEAIGLFGFAWTSVCPPVHWITSLIFSGLVGIANYAIYMATIDYMVAAYGPYAASATGGNGFARDFLAAIAALYVSPLHKNIGGKYHLSYASTLLVSVTIPIYIFYHKGPQIRARSKFTQSLEAEREKKIEKVEELGMRRRDGV